MALPGRWLFEIATLWLRVRETILHATFESHILQRPLIDAPLRCQSLDMETCSDYRMCKDMVSRLSAIESCSQLYWTKSRLRYHTHCANERPVFDLEDYRTR